MLFVLVAFSLVPPSALILYPAAIVIGIFETIYARHVGRPRWWTGLLAPLYAATVAFFDFASLMSTTADEALALGAVGFYIALSWPVLWGLTRFVQRWRQPS